MSSNQKRNEHDEKDSDSIKARKDETGGLIISSGNREASMDIENKGALSNVERAEEGSESPSTGSDGGSPKGPGSGNGSGAGSGGGYSADCSSSDGSAGSAVPENEMKSLQLGTVGHKVKHKSRSKKQNREADQASLTDSQFDLTKGKPLKTTDHYSLGSSSTGAGPSDSSGPRPQWNGVRIKHPMDPRIDLSTVGHVQTSEMLIFPIDVHVPPYADQHLTNNGVSNGMGKQNGSLTIDQYMNLMEVVRPFFHAYGISKTDPPQTNQSPTHSVTKTNDETDNKRTSRTNAQRQESQRDHDHDESGRSNPRDKADESEDDISSLRVVAPIKRKHHRRKGLDEKEDQELDQGSNDSSSNGDSYGSSNLSSDDRVQRQDHQTANREDTPQNDPERNILEGHNDAAHQDHHRMDPHESTSASSSSANNNMDQGQDDLIRRSLPAVVSEYSSSRNGSSGSNTNQFSTSGSGSANNTGSGTGSGSNPGGSSGSGNEQGAVSSNGNGSSGSGNDVKGSSEEIMDNSGETNSGEGNSDATNSNNERLNNVAENTLPSVPDAPDHNGQPNHNENSSKDGAVTKSQDAPYHSEINAVREKKLLDKKRKRMNMRREYEEQVEQGMESSEGRRGCDENTLIKPGCPITLDRVLSFTKTSRIVVSASPPFRIVHTNAAYCRLSGIDSHAVVGKPILTYLSIPDPQTLETIKNKSIGNATTGDGQDTKQDSKDSRQHETTEAEGLTAAEAAGRARAAASPDDSVERLVTMHGFGRWNIINLSAKALVGRKLEIPKLSSGAQNESREDGSNGSSITSNCETPYRHITCCMGVSPVVSSPEAFAVPTDREQDGHHHKGKRRKHHHHDTSSQSPHREILLHRKRHLITHYVIQLEPLENGAHTLASLESQSSTSTTLQAQLLGMTKSELRRQRRRYLPKSAAANGPHARDSEDDGLDSESSNPQEAVTAVG